MLEFLDKAAQTTQTTCDLGDATDGVLVILYYVRLAIRILQIAVPIGLILFGTIDMAKAVIAGDEKKMKEAQKPFVKRIVSAVIVFLIPFIVNVVVGFVTSNTEYKGCWAAASDIDPKTINFDVLEEK